MALTAEQEQRIWTMLNETRGQIGLTAYKDYIFGLLFYKYLSDKIEIMVTNNGQDSYADELRDIMADPDLLDGVYSDFGYIIEPGCLFSDWAKAIDSDTFNMGMLINSFAKFKQSIRPEAQKDFDGIFDGMRFDSADLGNNNQSRVRVMTSIINMLRSDVFALSEGDTVSDLYEYLLSKFATALASDMGQFYTPHEVSDVMARILTAGRENDEKVSIYDPTVGSASLLLTAAKYIENSGQNGAIEYFGQEKDATPYRLARMNLMMHGIKYSDIYINHGDTLLDDWPDGKDASGKDHVRMFDMVMANPPYSASWDNTDRESDPRWSEYGVAPKSKADYAFLLHCLYHLKQDGKMAVILPHGVLFRGAAEGRIRKALLKKGNIEAVIGLPAKLFLNTSIPVVILILSKNKLSKDVLFVDASNEFEKNKNQNRLTEEHVSKIVETVVNNNEIEKYSRVVSFDEIKENDYNLNIPRYIDTFEEEPEIDLAQVTADLLAIDDEIKNDNEELLSMLDDMVGTTPDADAMLQTMKGNLKKLW